MRSCAIAAILAVLTLPATAQDITAETIRALLQLQSPTVVVQSLDTGAETDNPWDAVLSHIEAGEPEWMELVPLLAPGTDAGTAESLTITLSRALKTNPAAVLSLLADGQYGVGDICVDNDIEVPWSEEVEFLDDALYAVASVLERPLLQVRNDCLIQLGAARVAALN